MGKLWDKIKSDIMKTTKVQLASIVSQSVIMGTLMLTWVFYIFLPVLEESNRYIESVAEPSFLITGSMMGFLMLSLWFTITWLNFTLCRYIMRILVFIIDRWEMINTKRNNKKQSVN